MFQAVDDAVLRFVQDHLQQPMLQYGFRDITSLGGDVLAFLFAIFTTGALWLTGNKTQAARFILTMLATAGIIVGLKLLIGRPCPLQPDPYQHVADFPAGVLSFHLPCLPSGHTTGSVVLYSLILFLIRDFSPGWFAESIGWPCFYSARKWATGWLIALPIVIGISRIVLSAHWSTDVIAGYMLGWAIVGVSRWLSRG